MKFRWLLLGFLSFVAALLIATVADAGTLQVWQFNPSTNSLVFTTNESVQPRAQLISDPTRLVIDLPGIQLGRSTTRQSVGGAIREVRAGQVDAETARLVVELSPGYTLDPEQIVFRGTTPTQWSVQIPTPELVSSNPTPPSNPSPSPSQPNQGTQIDSVQITGDGLFIHTSGATPSIRQVRSRDRRRLVYEVPGAVLSSQLQRNTTVNRNGVSRIEIEQADNSPPKVRITLHLSSSGRDRQPTWRASVSNMGGIVLIPSRSDNTANNPTPAPSPSPSPAPSPTPPTRPTPPSRPNPPANDLAVIQSVDLSSDNRQLLIRANQPIIYTDDWDRSGFYRIVIPDAQLADRVPGPRLNSSSPLQQVMLRQEDERTVVILVQPSTGIGISSISQPSGDLLALQLQGSIRPNPNPSTPTPTPPSTNPTPPTTDLPRPPRRGIVIALDPGHGGVDPGAVGRGGLKEIDVVLPVSLEVSSILERQGIQVVMTRSTNVSLELEPRVQIAERANADLFVSIHSNAISMDRPEVNGTETYYASDAGARFGRVVHDSMIRNMGMQDRGLRQARFYVIRNTSMPAVLLELGYVTGAQDAPRLSDPRWRSQMALAIAQGILQYVQQNF